MLLRLISSLRSKSTDAQKILALAMKQMRKKYLSAKSKLGYMKTAFEAASQVNQKIYQDLFP